jgi:hypothetical protein
MKVVTEENEPVTNEECIRTDFFQLGGMFLEALIILKQQNIQYSYSKNLKTVDLKK